MREILLVPVGAADPDLLRYLALMVGESLPCRGSVAERALSPDFAYDPVRRQYHSTELLKRLEALVPAGGGKVLGVTEQDLFVPILTFVFGEAHLGGTAAIVSTARLRSSFYGLPEDPRLLYLRAEKEALHEIGHTVGLVHCPDYGCVMRFSSSVEEVDVKGDRFCETCAGRIADGCAGS